VRGRDHEAQEAGFVAIEWVAAVALLLLPIVVLVATMPGWAERRHAATVAAREAANELAAAWPSGNDAIARLVATDVAADHGVDAADVVVRVPAVGEARGDYVEVDVDIRMPAVGVGLMAFGSWRYTAKAVRRIDDYRSR
jgi:hypothetical protein